MTTPEGPQKRRRVTQACDYCHRRSIRCRPADGDSEQKCVNCIDFGQPCTRDRTVRRRGAKPRHENTSLSISDAMRASASTGLSPQISEVLVSVTSSWTAPSVASQALVVDLIEIYFEVIYPIFPLFHRSSFLRKISRGEYTSNRELFAVTMAACALSSARVTDNALTNTAWDRNSLLSTSSVAFHDAAVSALPTTETPQQSLNLMRTYALLSLAAIQNGIFGTAAAGLIIDRIGRRMSLLVSFVIQGIALFVVAGLIKSSEDYAETNLRKSKMLGQGAASFVFIYLWFFCMFNIVPSWLYGTEIWPQDVRAKGYSFTILGWAVGCGMTTFLIPTMLSRIGWYTFVFFGVMNAAVLPIIYCFYVEPAGRSLEEVNLLFTSDSPFVKRNVEEYHRRVAAAGGNTAVAARRLMEEVEGIFTSDEEVLEKNSRLKVEDVETS